MRKILTRCLGCFKNQLLRPNVLSRNSTRSTNTTAKDIQSHHKSFRRKTRLKSICVKNEDKKICTAFCTSESYHFEPMKEYFMKDTQSYKIHILPKDAIDVMYLSKINDVESGDIFLFRRLGAFVCWNIPEDETMKLREILAPFEIDSYRVEDSEGENEMLNYCISNDNKTSLFDGDIYINDEGDTSTIILEKLAFSNAMALSVKLNMWESSVEKFSLSLQYFPETLKVGDRINTSRKEILQKIGELMTLRHQIYLYSDLLFMPDFYWDREDLEQLYTKTCTHLEVATRTAVMNEKLNLCSDLVEMLRSHLNERHGHRLEWMIIILISIEIFFEAIHYIERIL